MATLRSMKARLAKWLIANFVGSKANSIVNLHPKLVKKLLRFRDLTWTEKNSNSAITVAKLSCSISGVIGEALAGLCTPTSGRSWTK